MINIKQLTFNYKGSGELFRSLNLELKPGNIYGLLGRNGAGKTTLLKLISGLLHPKEGKLDILDFLPGDRNADFLQNIYFIPEEFYTPNMTGKDYLKAYKPFYPKFDEAQFENDMKEFELDTKTNLQSFSYGQKKKFLIAFGIACNTRLLILDEPTNGLDIPSKSQFRKLLAGSINEDRIILISTHQVRDMKNLIDPIVILESGKILFNYDLASASKKLKVIQSKNLPEDQDILFSEEIMGNYTIVVENRDGDEQSIDLELLFNTVVANNKKVKLLMEEGQ